MKHSSFLHTFYKLCFCIAIIASTTVAHAVPGVPEIISYQGRLTDDNGVLLGGTGTTYYFKFSIWDSPTVGGGTKLWPAGAPGATTLTVTDGVFDVNIGDTGDGYPDALTYDFQSNDTVYLQVEVSPTGSGYETLGPRPRITSASTAINAKTLSGLPSTYFLDATNLTNFDSRAIAAPLTGYTSGAGVITASDTILSAIQKLNGNIAGGGSVTSVFGRSGVVTAQSGDYTTDLVTEATNLYYTQARFDTAFGLKSTTNLAEGTNLYYTDTRFDTRLATKDTDDIAEGANLYYTDARARAAISASGAPLSYDGVTGVISIDQANTTTDGYLSSTDWNTFNNKGSGTVTSVSGTTNRITSTGGATPVIDISASYVGQSSITTVGTITSGVWNGTAIANANLANSALTIGSTNIALGATTTTLAGLSSVTSTAFIGNLTGTASGNEVPLTFSTGITRSTNTVSVDTTQNIAKLSNLTTNGFVKTSGGDGTLTIDTSTYLTGNQSITLSGAVTGSGSTAITTTLANSVVGIANLSATGTPSASTYLRGDNTWAAITAGTVTSVSVATANGFGGSVANATTTPAITITTNITGLLKGDGTGVSAAVAGTDYQAPITLTTTGSSGAATLIGNTLNIPQYSGGGGSYIFSTGLTDTASTITNNLSTGISGGQSVIGGTGSGENLTLVSTSNGTKGSILFGTSAYDEVNNRLGITETTPTSKLHITTNAIGVTQSDANGMLLQNSTAATAGIQQYSPATVFRSNAWLTTTLVSHTLDYRIYARPTGGTTAARGGVVIQQSLNGAAYSDTFEVGQTTTNGSGYNLRLGGVTVFALGGGTTQFYGSSSGAGFYNSAGSLLFAALDANGRWAFTPSSTTVTSGTVNSINHTATFGPTSGTGVWNQFVLTPTINQTGGASGISRGLYINPTITAAADWRAIEIASTSMGSGAAGPVVMIGRNSHATPGAGSINLLSNAGTNGYVWQDTAGNLRIHTAAPTNANDTAGTVVGAQSSTRETKQDIEDYTEYRDALALIVDAPLHTFRYIKEVEGYGSDSPLAKTRIGFIADEVDQAFMVGNVIDQVSVNGLLMAAIKEIDLNMQVLPVLEDRTLATKIADFLRGIAENGIAIVDNLKTKKVQTQELCVGDEDDEVCITKDQLRAIIEQNGFTPNPSTGGESVEQDPEQAVEDPIDTGSISETPTEEQPTETPIEEDPESPEEIVEEAPAEEEPSEPTEEESAPETSPEPAPSE